jgi:hypothetical protein
MTAQIIVVAEFHGPDPLADMPWPLLLWKFPALYWAAVFRGWANGLERL